MKHQMAQDVNRLRHAYADGRTTTEDDLYESVGVEKFLSARLMRRVVLHKREHSSVVIAAGHIYQGAGYQPKESYVSAVAEASSQWTRDMAHLTALSRYGL